MRKCLSIVVMLALLWASLVSIALAREEGDILPSPYSEHGANTYSCLNIFKAVFPDTKPGEEEYYFDVNWYAAPYRGYLSLPLSLPGHGKHTSEKLDVFMRKVGVPVRNDQYALYDVQSPDYKIPCTYRRGLEGSRKWALVPPLDDYIAVMANTPREEIKSLAEAEIWQVNLRSSYPEVGQYGVPPGYLSCYYFYPPDLQVKDLKVAVSGGKATATATFYNAYIFGGMTDFHLYLVRKDGSKQLLKEQDAYIGSWDTFTLAAQFDATPDVVAVAASVARPWTGTEWGYGKFITSEKIGGAPLIDLAGYAVEMGSGAYPQEILALMKDRWGNNVKQVPAQQVDLAVSVAFPTKKYVMSWMSDAVFPSATVKVFRTDGGRDPVKFRLTMTGPAGPKVVEMTITSKDKPQIFSYGFTATKAGKYTVQARVEAVGVQETNLANNTDSDWTEVVKRPRPPTGEGEPNVHSELGG